jgi:hypothetical protein
MAGGNSILDGDYIGFEIIYAAIHGSEDNLDTVKAIDGAGVN